MAKWSVQPEEKKSIVERNIYTNGENKLIVEIGWRGGEFYVYTDDDTPPELEEGVDIYNCDYEVELVETYDNCWDDFIYDDCNDETTECLESFFAEGNSCEELEEHGWTHEDCEMHINSSLIIVKVKD